MLRSTTAVRRIAIGWQKLVPPTHKSGTNKYQAFETEIDNIYREIAEAPTKVTAIPWADYEAKIEDKAAFAEIKAKHEAKTFVAPKPIVKMTEAEFNQVLASSQKEASMYTELIAQLETEAEATLAVKSEWPFWNAQQHFDSVPGVEAEYDRLADNLHAFVPFELEEALNSYDLQKNIVDKLDAGLIPEIDIATYDLLPAESPVRIAIEKEYSQFATKINAAGATAIPLDTLLAQARAAQAANPNA